VDRAVRTGTGAVWPAAAAAKVRAGAAVEVVARLARQVHGAIGFTQEYKLHHLTRRLWSWRGEAGTELHWSRVLGAALLNSGDTLWGALTRVV
jgi:acyl-CoA dehydrogenase